MEKLWSSLKAVKELLEQLSVITQNQRTILIGEAGEEGLVLLEQMFEYKGEVMNELEQVEAEFQIQYSTHRSGLIDSPQLIEVQKQVAEVLHLKEGIVLMEQQNVIWMQERARKCSERVQVPQNPQKVAAAYRKYTKI